MSRARRLFTLAVVGCASALSVPAFSETLLANYTFEAGATCIVQGWTTVDLSGRGDFAALFKGQVQQDPSPNLTCFWAFISGSTAFYTCGGFPLQAAVPFSNPAGQYLENEIWSPSIPLVGAGDAIKVKFDVYEDLPLDNLVFYTWKVRYITGGVPGPWITDQQYYYGDFNLWDTFTTYPTPIPPGVTSVQVALGCVDNCDVWCGVWGSGACHSHAPLLDHVQVFRVDTSPLITAITDVGNDQGRRVRIVWERSPWDLVGSPGPVTGYGIYRRQDAFLTAGLKTAAPSEPSEPLPVGVNRALLAAGWDYVTTVPARAAGFPTGPAIDLPELPKYQTIVETLCDSTVAAGQCWSVFMVSAMTGAPAVFYDSPPDSGYSIDNLTPPPPAAFSVAYNVPGGNVLQWAESTAPDLDHYNVYRSTGGGLAVLSGSLVFSTSDTHWQDPTGTPQHQYSVSAVDFSGNESAGSSPVTVTGLGRVPTKYALHEGVPNPFSSSTVLRYQVPTGGGAVSLRIYDAAGRLVANVLDRIESGGDKSVVWNGRDSAGRAVASGVYFCRMTAPGFTDARKLVVTR